MPPIVPLIITVESVILLPCTFCLFSHIFSLFSDTLHIGGKGRSTAETKYLKQGVIGWLPPTAPCYELSHSEVNLLFRRMLCNNFLNTFWFMNQNGLTTWGGIVKLSFLSVIRCPLHSKVRSLILATRMSGKVGVLRQVALCCVLYICLFSHFLFFVCFFVAFLLLEFYFAFVFYLFICCCGSIPAFISFQRALQT